MNIVHYKTQEVLSDIHVQGSSYVLKACDKNTYSDFLVCNLNPKDPLTWSLTQSSTQTCTHTCTHLIIFYGVHARLQLLYKVLLELDHRGWDRMPHERCIVEAALISQPWFNTACGIFSVDSVSCTESENPRWCSVIARYCMPK